MVGSTAAVLAGRIRYAAVLSHLVTHNSGTAVRTPPIDRSIGYARGADTNHEATVSG